MCEHHHNNDSQEIEYSYHEGAYKADGHSHQHNHDHSHESNHENNHREEYRVRGEQAVNKVKELIHQGNVRKITIKDKDGNVILSLPLTLGVIGAVAAPMIAAVGAVAALVTECTISIERKE